jgi:fatty-acyl-CoA synthase
MDMMRTFWREHGVRKVQVWGMTETTHAATLLWTEEEVLSGAAEPRTPQGYPVLGTQIRVIDDEGAALPRDGNSIGHLQVRGHWCASAYLKRPDVALNEDGWLKTGDLAAIDAQSGLRLTDRLKDVIKSGGEWVSSIDLENAALGHPDVAAAAVIGVPHPKWQERPVIFVVARAGRELSAESLRSHLATVVARWWLPDEVIHVAELPYNSNGKVRKDLLREHYRRSHAAA